MLGRAAETLLAGDGNCKHTIEVSAALRVAYSCTDLAELPGRAPLKKSARFLSSCRRPSLTSRLGSGPTSRRLSSLTFGRASRKPR